MTNNTMEIENNHHKKAPPKRNSNNSDTHPNSNIINNDTNDTNNTKTNNNSTNSITNYLTNQANNANKNQNNSTTPNPYKKSKSPSSSSTNTGTTASNTTAMDTITIEEDDATMASDDTPTRNNHPDGYKTRVTFKMSISIQNTNTKPQRVVLQTITSLLQNMKNHDKYAAYQINNKKNYNNIYFLLHKKSESLTNNPK